MGILLAGVTTLCFGILFQLRGNRLWAASTDGMLGWAVYLCAMPLGETARFFAAAVAIALYAEIAARMQRAPASTFIAPAVMPLVPGGAIYQTMLYAISGETLLFATTARQAMLTVVAISLGIVTSSSVFRLFFFPGVPLPFHRKG